MEVRGDDSHVKARGRKVCVRGILPEDIAASHEHLRSLSIHKRNSLVDSHSVDLYGVEDDVLSGSFCWIDRWNFTSNESREPVKLVCGR